MKYRKKIISVFESLIIYEWYCKFHALMSNDMPTLFLCKPQQTNKLTIYCVFFIVTPRAIYIEKEHVCV